jgi:hypothetical protein
MSTAAMAFMGISVTFVTALVIWCYYKVFTTD